MPEKFGVYIPEDLRREIERYMKTLGFRSKSRLIQEALRLFIVEHKWQVSGEVAGVIGVVYNHDVGDVDKELTDVQHKYIDEIISTVHVHLDKERCMLTIIVRGSTERIRELIRQIEGLRGILTLRSMLLSAK
ncbi:MAG: CopG family ribbon-helix-helix protein [Thermoprotei archaeon]|nr:CopG family ribbon-helix-helix protein [Thermoprotei archaeon]